MSRKVCQEYLQDCKYRNSGNDELFLKLQTTLPLFEIYIRMNELVDNIFVTIRSLKFSSKIRVMFVTTYN